jgi:hypothetical protein
MIVFFLITGMLYSFVSLCLKYVYCADLRKRISSWSGILEQLEPVFSGEVTEKVVDQGKTYEMHRFVLPFYGAV